MRKGVESVALPGLSFLWLTALLVSYYGSAPFLSIILRAARLGDWGRAMFFAGIIAIVLAVLLATAWLLIRWWWHVPNAGKTASSSSGAGIKEVVYQQDNRTIEKVKVAFDIVADDCWQLINRTMLFNRRTFLKVAWQSALLSTVLGALLYVILGNINSLILPWLVAFVVSIAAYILPRKRAFFRSVYLQTPGVLGGHTMTISRAGLRDTTEVNEDTVSWAAVVDIVSTDHYIVFMRNRVAGHVVPARCFATRLDMNTFLGAATTFWKAKDVPQATVV